MNVRKLLVPAALAAAAGTLAAAPVACGGGGGGIGLGIATIGVSSILSGMSPGWCVRDPGLSAPSATPSSVSSTSVTAEPALEIDDGEEIDRVIVTGGTFESLPLIEGFAHASANGTTLEVKGVYSEWSGGVSATEFTSVTRTIDAADTAFSISLADLSGTVLTRAEVNPGTQVKVRFHAIGGHVTIDTSRTRISYASGQIRGSTFEVRPEVFRTATFELDERLRLEGASAGSAGGGASTDTLRPPCSPSSRRASRSRRAWPRRRGSSSA